MASYLIRTNVGLSNIKVSSEVSDAASRTSSSSVKETPGNPTEYNLGVQEYC